MDSKKPSIKDIRATYTEDQRAIGRLSGAWNYFVVRRVSFYPAWLFIRLGISANKVSVLGIIFMVAGCVFLAFGSYKAIILGAVLLNIYKVLDLADGNVARYTKQTDTPFGEFIEPFSSFLDRALIFSCAGIGAFNNPGFLPIEMAGWIFIVLGILTSALNFVTPGITAHFQKRSYVEASGNVVEYEMFGHFRLYRIATQAIGGLYLILLLLLAILNSLGIFVLFYALIGIVRFAATTFKTLASRCI